MYARHTSLVTTIHYEGTKRVRMLKEFGLEQMVLAYEQVKNSCMTPIHMQILDAEQLTLARMRSYLLTDCGLTLRNIKECRVDSCLIQAGNRREEVVLEKMEQYTRDGVLARDDYKKALEEGAKFGGAVSKVLRAMNGSTATTKR